MRRSSTIWMAPLLLRQRQRWRSQWWASHHSQDTWSSFLRVLTLLGDEFQLNSWNWYHHVCVQCLEEIFKKKLISFIETWWSKSRVIDVNVINNVEKGFAYNKSFDFRKASGDELYKSFSKNFKFMEL